MYRYQHLSYPRNWICLIGLMGGFVGLFQVAKLGGSGASMGQFMEMRIMMAIFLGGVLVTGGMSAKIYRLAIGAFTSTIISNGLILEQCQHRLRAGSAGRTTHIDFVFYNSLLQAVGAQCVKYDRSVFNEDEGCFDVWPGRCPCRGS